MGAFKMVPAPASYAELFPPPYSGQTRALPELRSHPALVQDVEWSPDGLRRAAEARCSPEKDLVLVTTDMSQLDIATNLLANLADVGVHHYLLLASDAKTCRAVSDKLACVWSSLMSKFTKRLREAATNSVRTLWLIRQIYIGRLARLGFNPMMLDADVILFTNPFPLLRKHLPGRDSGLLAPTEEATNRPTIRPTDQPT